MTKTRLRWSALLLAPLLPALALAADWSNWRGPQRTGTSPETGLVDSWSPEGENLIWRVDFVGRSTPVVVNGRVCANGRAGEGIERQEMVACFDAGTGEKLWERRFNVYHTSVPWTRVGWAHLAADPETGYIYVQGVGGLFFCLDSKDGSVVWQRKLIEEFGFMEGYGGRTQTPLVDADRVIVTFSNTSWGSEGKPLHRVRAFDKRSGELLWASQPAESQADKNTQSTPNLLIVDGRRLIVAGNGGGGIHAVEASTGEPVWDFQLSKRGINTSVLVDGTTVYAAHSEENVDEGSMGRVVAIDGTGTGDVTTTHEIWRAPLGVGFSSPALADGVLYVLDNSADLHALDAKTGKKRWELAVGRVGKASAVVADGKIYLTEVNGRFLIIEPGETEGKILDLDVLETASGRDAEIYSSAAVAYGRIFFTAEEGLYCLGSKDAPFAVSESEATWPPEERAPAGATPARLRVVPAEVLTYSDESSDFRVLAVDALGRPIGEVAATWSLESLAGTVDAQGLFTPDAEAGSQTGMVVAKVGDLEARGRLRALSRLPLAEDFESSEPGSRPEYMMGYLARWAVEDKGGEKVLAKGPSPIKIHRHITFLGHPDDSDYVIIADLQGTKAGRIMPDMGLINSGYTLELLGNHQRLQVRSWQSGLRMMQEIDYPWQPEVWYRMKLDVDVADGVAVVRGKVWDRTAAEPADWSITVEDPLPIEAGASGLSGYSPTPIYFDNVKVLSD
jgi:outer membrane protein assembly factor BamB